MEGLSLTFVTRPCVWTGSGQERIALRPARARQARFGFPKRFCNQLAAVRIFSRDYHLARALPRKPVVIADWALPLLRRRARSRPGEKLRSSLKSRRLSHVSLLWRR